MFNLTDYLDEIRAISERNNCTRTAAVDRMVINLNTFNEYNKGTGTLNYHQIGHEWGALPTAEKVTQKQRAKRLVSEEPPATTRRTRQR